MTRRGGFTLIEVLVAASIAAVVLAGAEIVLEQLIGARKELTAATAKTDHARNARRLMEELVEQVDVSVPGPAGATPDAFHGDAGSASFKTWCTVAGGWKKPCDATLSLEQHESITSVNIRTSLSDSASIQLGHQGELLYLLRADDGGEWVRVWGPSPTPPMAVGVATERDTIVWRIGDRG